ncbi:O-antigen ligase family protein, partial [Ralstonia pseudosolanacearum]
MAGDAVGRGAGQLPLGAVDRERLHDLRLSLAGPPNRQRILASLIAPPAPDGTPGRRAGEPHTTMMNWSDKHSVRADRWYAPLAVFLLIYPVLTVLKQGSASALLIAAGVLSLGAGVAVRRALSGPATPDGADRLVRLTGWALCMPLAAVILSEAWHG